MEATSKKEFFSLLIAELNRIGVDDTAEITADFEEHFRSSAENGVSEREACHHLGDIGEIARNYLNLESSRINSMVARDVERKRISLMKPGKSVPADLSLMNARDAANSDNIRSYTPQHFSSEIYPNQSAANYANTGNNTNTQNGNFGGADANNNVNSQGSSNASSQQNVADAFSNAGRAVADAAKVTGHAIADAFNNSGVKDAVIGAGKSSANAVKAAGKSVANAVSKAKSDHEQRKAEQERHKEDPVPQPNDEFRRNNTASNVGTIPPQYTKAKTKGGYKFIDVKSLKPNLNTGKFIGVLLMDIFVWWWVIASIASIIIGLFFGGLKCVFWESFKCLFGYYDTRFITNVFLFTGFIGLGISVGILSVWIARLFAKLIIFIVNTHIKAIYDL